MPAVGQHATLWSGDTHRISISIVDAQGTPVAVTNAATLVWVLRYDRDPRRPPILTKTLGHGVELTDATRLLLTLFPDETENLAGIYYHECQLTTGEGDVIMLLTGTLTVVAETI